MGHRGDVSSPPNQPRAVSICAVASDVPRQEFGFVMLDGVTVRTELMMIEKLERI